jgi:hypothetical protein
MTAANVIGWREWIAFPLLDIPLIKAKIDTGAKTSALHTFDLETFTSAEGVEMVRFKVHPLRKQPDVVRICEAPVFDRRVVRDSGGHSENRITIETELKIGPHTFSTPVTLTNREDMLFRVLVGRRTIQQGQMLVDSASSYLQGRIRKKQFGDFYKELNS